MKAEVTEFLAQHNIEYILHEHPAVYTCDEAKEHCSHIPGLHCKNLFLKQKKDIDTEKFLMAILPADKRIDLKQLALLRSTKKIIFGPEKDLYSTLKLKPGSVSPFGLINDPENQVILYIDKTVWDANIITFHPNINNETLELSQEMFHKCIQNFNNPYFIEEF